MRRPRRNPATPEGKRITTDPAAIPDAAIPDAVVSDADVADAGDDEAEDERGPLRRCVLTRERQDRTRMIRFVIGPDRQVVPDLAGRLPGRGIWLSARGDVLEAARAQGKLAGTFARAARGPVTVPPDLSGLLTTGLTTRIGELLGLARRAGQAVAGFQKAGSWLREGRAALILQAADGSPEERMRFRGASSLPALTPLDGAALGAVFGRPHVVHVAVAHGRLAEALAIEAERLAGLTCLPMAVPAGTTEDSAAAKAGRAKNETPEDGRTGVRTDG